MVHRVCCVSFVETWMIDTGIAPDVTDSQSAALRPRPLTKYDDK